MRAAAGGEVGGRNEMRSEKNNTFCGNKQMGLNDTIASPAIRWEMTVDDHDQPTAAGSQSVAVVA